MTTQRPHHSPHRPSRPADDRSERWPHATVELSIEASPEAFFRAYSQFVRYRDWAPEWQGPAHWLYRRKGGVGSRFILYDKPAGHHLVHFGTVTNYDPDRRFVWKAPFSEWARVDVGSELEISPTSSGTQIRETLFFEGRKDHLPVIEGFQRLQGLRKATLEEFLEARIQGLDRLIVDGAIDDSDLADGFSEHTIEADDWPGRISRGQWVRVLYADGEVDFDAPPETVFNAFTRFSRYRDWTPMIHVGAEWLDIRRGGVGSKFMLWEKPGDRHVLHQAVITEFERNRRFTWRAPFSEWGKVFIGTSARLRERPDGGTRMYHVLYVDIPDEYIPVFAGFGSLHGFDIEFETFHIFEEARGFHRLLEADAFSPDQTAYLFDRDESVATDWPLQEGRRWPKQTATLVPDRTVTYEELLVEVSDILADSVPSPAFLRKYRNLERTRRFGEEFRDDTS